ncbi:methyl-accepting chemotaxis protein [Roseateles saccharophilus]|uniref:Methyl-accepting chemotaxis sensory transducer with Cache sensor n=1 Tax=Roseateles saccharophilus TaxID=304 RepID=A0A4R3VE51_ROSSA|nr:methyl-accepting chemotaxis protein [Roseateles saccharophilus]MDG0831565.1 methyl-accepting chemotaxis protein [Roseateles saccharophilus]TCV01025.1 methyl-accepting chemotaxis sensory transducer with Cache sensor [Roseateles saccharophilus]
MLAKFKSLRSQLVALAVLSMALGLLALAVANYLTARGQVLDDLQKNTLGLAQAQAQAISDWAASKAAVVKSTTPVAAVPEADAPKFLVQAHDSGGFDNSYVAFADKRILFNAPQNLPPGYDPTGRPWYLQAAGASGPVLTSPYKDAATQRMVVTFAVAVKEGGNTTAVAAGDVFLDNVVNIVKSIKPTPSSFAFLTDKDGNFIAHPDLKRGGTPAKDVVTGLTPDRLHQLAAGARLEPADIDGVAHELLATEVRGTDWVLVIALNKSEALASLRSLAVSSVVAAAIVLVLAGLVIGGLVAQRLRRLAQLDEVMQDIASGDGDLTRRVSTAGEDELAAIARSFNTFVEKLSGVLREIRDSSESVRTASQEIAVGNQDLSARTEQTASSLEQTSSSAEQLTDTVKLNAERAAQANQLVSAASSVAQRGGDVVSRVVSTMQDISASSSRIADIIGVIDGIAFQTNILALNAAVEAARAGEQGRGFAVVASEVRSLAQRSADAAKEIKTLISASVERVESGSRLVHEAGETMTEIVGSVGQVTGIMQEIAAASSEQSGSIVEVSTAVGHLDQLTQQNAALVEESAAAAEALKQQAERLAAAVGAFRLT